MNDYNSVRINCTPCNEDITDLAAAFLADAGFESFEPDSEGLTAYIKASPETEKTAAEALANFPIDVKFDIKCTFIEGEDWNAEWEKNYFKPIVIGNQCVVHSTFHKDVPNARYDIVIDPKMAFGTGHHDTTSQMMRFILDLNLENKSVIDVGTGTGILSILAKMRGASTVTGIEIDKFAYLNAIDHTKLNNTEITVIHGDADCLSSLESADFVFANINRNIILQDINKYADALNNKGEMLLSGFYENDVNMIEQEAEKYGLSEIQRLVSPAGWTALRLRKE